MNPKLLSDIQAALKSISATAPILTSSSKADKLYELFVLSCVVQALLKIGARMEARGCDDRPTTTLTFRLAPGLIYNPSSAPGFVYFEYRGKEYELQNSLRVCGRSKVRHELDVCIVQRKHAARCRVGKMDLPQPAVRFLAECKYYGSALPLHLGREFVGLCAEFAMRTKVIVSNSDNAEISMLVIKHKGTVNLDITPFNTQQLDVFVNWLANEFQQALM